VTQIIFTLQVYICNSLVEHIPSPKQLGTRASLLMLTRWCAAVCAACSAECRQPFRQFNIKTTPSRASTYCSAKCLHRSFISQSII